MKVMCIVGLMRDDSTVLLVGSVDDPNDEGAWYTVTPTLFARAESDIYKPIVPAFERGALVDWTPAPAETNLDARDAACATCEFVEQEYANANASDLTRDALALQNAALRAEIERLRAALRALGADVKPAQPAQQVADMSKVCNNCCYSDGRENCDGGAWFCHRCGAHYEP